MPLSKVDDDGGVARADAKSRRAGAVGSLDHAGTARGQDDVGLGHERVGGLERDGVDPADDALGCASSHGGAQHDKRGLGGALLRARVRADHDGVARLEGQQALEDRRGGGVGGGDDRRDDTDRLGDLDHASRLVALDDAAGLGVLIGVVDVLRGVVVLGHLVLEAAHAGLLHGHLGQGDALGVGSQCRRVEDLVHLLLREGRELGLCLAHLCELRDQVVALSHDDGRGIVKDCLCLFGHR